MSIVQYACKEALEVLNDATQTGFAKIFRILSAGDGVWYPTSFAEKSHAIHRRRARVAVQQSNIYMTRLSNHRVSHAYWLHKKVICGMNGKITQILIYSFYLCPQIDVLYTRTHLEQARALWIISFLWKSKWKCNFTAKTNEPNWEPIPVKWTKHWRCFQDPYAWVGMIKHISNSITLYPCGQE